MTVALSLNRPGESFPRSVGVISHVQWEKSPLKTFLKGRALQKLPGTDWMKLAWNSHSLPQQQNYSGNQLEAELLSGGKWKTGKSSQFFMHLSLKGTKQPALIHDDIDSITQQVLQVPLL